MSSPAVRSSYTSQWADPMMSYGIGNAGARPRIDAFGGDSAPALDLRGLMEQAYSIGATRSPQELESTYRVETEDFPDVFDMPKFDEIFMARVNSKTTWINEVMPSKRVYKLDVKGDALYFNHTQPERMPEESVPNYMSHERKSYSDTIVRWGKGVFMESNYFHTPWGRVEFFLELEQLNNCVMLAQNHSCLCALYYDERAQIATRWDQMKKYESELGNGATLSQVMNDSFKNFGILNRDPMRIKERVAQWTVAFENQADGRVPSRIVFPNGSSFTWDNANLGSYAQTGYRFDETPSLQQVAANGLKYNESFGTLLDDGRINHDPAYNERTIGGYFHIDRSCLGPHKEINEGTVVEIYDESQDQISQFKLSSNIKYAGIWNNFDNCDTEDAYEEPSSLTEIGYAYMDGCTNWYDLYKRQAPQREIKEMCAKIAKDKNFMERIIDRILGYEKTRESDQITEGIEQLRKLLPQLNIAPTRKPSPSSDPYFKNADKRSAPQTFLAGRATTDWLNKTVKKFRAKVTPKVKRLFNEISRLPNASTILQEWENAVSENDGDDFYALGQKVFINIAVNKALETSIKNAVAPTSAVERFLQRKNTTYFDQVFLNDIADELHEEQEKDVQYLGQDRLTLYTNDELRSLDYASLLFPLSASNVVLFQPSTVDFLNDPNWSAKCIRARGSASRNFFNGSRRMAMLFHSIEVSVIYHALLNGDKSDNLVQRASPNPSLIDWDRQLKTARELKANVFDFQSDYTNTIDMIRAYIRQPGAAAYQRLQNQFAQAQSGTSGQVGTRIKSVPLLSSYNEALVSKDVKTFVQTFHGVVRPADGWVLNGAEELKDPLAKYFWTLVNTLEPKGDQLTDTQIKAFVKALGLNVMLFNSMMPKYRFTMTVLENTPTYNIVRSYIEQAVAEMMLKPAETLKHLTTDWETFFTARQTNADEAKELINKFSPIFQQMMVALQETQPSAKSNIIKSFESFRSTGKVAINPKINALREWIAGLNLIDEKKYGVSMETVKLEAEQLCEFVLQIWDTTSNEDLFEQLYTKTQIATKFPDLRQCTSQAVAVLIVLLSNMPVVKNRPNPTQSKFSRVNYVIEQFTQTPYVNKRLGNWNASQTKITEVARVLSAGEKFEYGDDYKELESRSERDPIVLADEKESRDPTADDAANLLRLLPVSDAWLYKRSFEYEFPPATGIRVLRPHQTYLMGTVLMLVDREVGNMCYMPPNITAGEDAKQQVMHVTFGMYYKGIINSGKLVLRIYDVFCRKYCGGNGMLVWDPLNREHIAEYSSSINKTDYKRDMFIQPIDFWSDNNHGCALDITGTLPRDIPVSDLEAQHNYSPVSEVLCRIWGWKNDACMKPDTYEYLSRYQPRFNTLCMQDHVGRWDGKEYKRIITNKGAWGPNIYAGVRQARSGGSLKQSL